MNPTTRTLQPGQMIPATVPPFAVITADGSPVASAYTWRQAAAIVTGWQNRTGQPHYVRPL